jgi:transcriptional regulator with XRE-family HTH domain
MTAERMLRHARRRAGMSQRELARSTGVVQPAIARIELGGVSPTIETLERLLAGAGFSLEVAPRLGVGVDRSLIQEMLRQTPEQRLIAAAAAAGDVTALTTVSKRRKRA